MSNPAETGEEGFLAGLKLCNCEPEKQSGVLVFTVVPVGGIHAGQSIETGVSVDELKAWPSVPPHWVHLPEYVAISRTNMQSSSVSGWLKHSRNVANWGNAAIPAQAWLAHVRAILEDT